MTERPGMCFPRLMEDQEIRLCSNYFDFIYNYRDRIKGMSSSKIVSLYLKYAKKPNDIESYLKDVNNVADLIKFGEKYTDKFIFLKVACRERQLKEMHLMINSMRENPRVRAITEYLIKHKIDDKNIPDNYIERILKVLNQVKEDNAY